MKLTGGDVLMREMQTPLRSDVCSISSIPILTFKSAASIHLAPPCVQVSIATEPAFR